MKFIKFLLVGIVFGITLAKAEIISWFRIYEMFRFEAFHMYGVIGSAVILGVIILQIVKRTNLKNIYGQEITIAAKAKGYKNYIFGGIFFGLGWALVGACPGPMFILLGYGYLSVIIIIIGALMGAQLYGMIKTKLPH